MTSRQMLFPVLQCDSAILILLYSTYLVYTHVTINMSITIQKANVIRRATVVAVDVAVMSKGGSAVSGPTL